ncbi:PSD1 and planctomycete cytochrome C domain-containing protein [Verrucomicrobium spinosum]|uniref:PSD1 and planctomycete cytochrome C domain-containing protein n=1 Tax=Verrucomicrobium spinosum TaxID=2736 RepID=UPI0001744E1B|nr:PSD1 and planctomycete cytochrome C domain-containing protein [Verrucomicrobium spinosum]
MKFIPPILLLLLVTANAQGEGKVKFNRDIRPIMSDTCFHCHGPDKSSRKGGLRLDIREEALKPGKSGALPILPGEPDKSEIIKRIFTTDHDDLMPPEEAHKELTPEQKAIFKQWVAEGAVYEAHWAYTPLVRPPVPGADAQPAGEKAVDAFIQAGLSARQIQPSAEADRRTLLRRLSLDLTGLPPTPEELEAFVKDAAPDAYAREVERLLRSPHYGERMAVWWLDVARFTDTVGYHGDQNQRIFPYRDYVIDAFNQNKRFDQFTIEQLAGDLLPEPTKEQLVATGFNRLNMVTREGGAQPKEYLSKYGAERVRTVGGAWMGATLGCSECHDHKFDPFTAKDFYAMQAFFADVKQWGVYSDYGYSPNPELKGWNNEYPFPPEIEVTSPYLKQRSESLRKRMLALAAGELKQTAVQQAFQTWRTAAAKFLNEHNDGWLAAQPIVSVTAAPVGKKPAASPAEPKKTVPAPLVDAEGWITASSKAADNSRIELSPGAMSVAAVRVQLRPHGAGGSILRNGGEGSTMVKVSVAVKRQGTEKEQGLVVAYADADFQDPRYSSTVQVLNLKDGWKTASLRWNAPQQSVWQLERPVSLKEGDTLVVKLDANSAASCRVQVSPFAPVKPNTPGALASMKDDLASPDIPARLAETFLRSAPIEPVAAMAEYRQFFSQWLECREGKTWTMVTQAMPPLTVKVLPRGNWMDETGEVTLPAVPEFLPASFRAGAGQPRATRLDLARWLCSQDNPLTPRAFANRLWKQFFGNGLSIVVDDLGAQGEPPSHPELLDWLASEFRDSGWNVKHLIRLMVLSHTYRQSSSLRPELKDIDPNNRLLASQNPRRLDAEFVRDNALFIAGRLNLELGGPSVKPYQPEGYYENLQFPDRKYVAETDDRQWRRGVYMHWQRTFLHPMLANFDAPMRDECTANRTLSNTPQQALTLLNDPTFVEAARVFAERLLKLGVAGDDARLNAAMELAAGRPLNAPERSSLTYFLNSQREQFEAAPEDAAKVVKAGISPAVAELDPVELAAWTSVARVVLNLQETITRY